MGEKKCLAHQANRSECNKPKVQWAFVKSIFFFEMKHFSVRRRPQVKERKKMPCCLDGSNEYSKNLKEKVCSSTVVDYFRYCPKKYLAFERAREKSIRTWF